MKRILTTLLAIIIALSLPLSAAAINNAQGIYTVNGITVEFSENSLFTPEEQAVITQLIVDGIDNSSATTYNVLCTLFGHKTTTETIGVIEHCYREAQPRCLKTIEDVTACSRCDYVSIDVVSTYYVVCCD